MYPRRKPRLNLLPVLLPLALRLACLPAIAQAPSATAGPLPTRDTDTTRVPLVDNDTILRMHKAGLGDDVLIQTVQLQPGHYDTRPDDLIALKAAGLSDRVISAMQAHGTGLVQRDSQHDPYRATLRPGSSAPIVPPPSVQLPPGVDEIGVYYKSKDGPYIELPTERVVFKSAGTVKSILSQGILAKDMNGHLEAPKSPLVLPTGVQILIFAPAGTDGNEYDFLRLREHKDYREFRTLTGGILHSESGSEPDELEFHPQKIGPELYTFTVPVDIEKGEYGVLPPGAANVQGLAGTGKIFTFSIAE
jgi:hypothetical protein